MKTYYSYLDTLKGIAILLMVMAHTISWSYLDSHFLTETMSGMVIEELYAAIIWKIIYSFHMPLLFFVSGFLFYKEGQIMNFKTVKQTTLKRAQRLLVPYITTGIFVSFLRGYFGYWFFIVLFILNVVVMIELYIEEKLQTSKKQEIVGHFCFFVLLSLFAKIYRGYLPCEVMQLGSLPHFYLVFIFGYIVHKYKVVDELISNQKVSLICIILYVVLMILINYYGVFLFLSSLIPLTAISYLFNYSKQLRNNAIVGGVNIIGKKSMEIYVFHLFFVMAFPEFGAYILGISNMPLSLTLQLLYSFVISVIAIVLSIGMSDLIKSNKYLAMLLFGS